jgi:hypothetical protein
MKKLARKLFILSLLTLSLFAAALAQTPSAYAASTTVHGKIHFFWGRGHSGGGGGGGNMLYHGGPVMAGTVKAYAIFWKPKGTFLDSTYISLLKRYFRDVGDSPLYENNEQYTDTSGQAPEDANLANTWVDTQPYPSAPILFDSDIQAEVVHAMSVNGWTPGLNHIFFVYTTLNEIICTDTSEQDCSAPMGQFCAYHSSFGPNGAPIIYGAMPYDGNTLATCYNLSGSPNHDAAADAEISTTSHEQMEAATDPLSDGWFDKNGLTGEIGDKCAYVYGPLKPDGSNVSWNGHHYVVQSEWDNKVSGCVLSGP